MREPLSCDRKPDPVDRVIRNLTAEEMVDWLIEYKGMPEEARLNVTMNLREQYRYYQLQGRLERYSAGYLLAVANIWLAMGFVTSGPWQPMVCVLLGIGWGGLWLAMRRKERA